MDIRQLRVFLAAAETGSISRAAARLRVAQPSVSQQIHRLERELGTPLFDRLSRGVALTDAGRALLPRARAILDAVREARDALDADVERGVGRFAVGAIPTMAPYLLPPVLAALRDEFPAAHLTVREDLTESLVELLIDNRLDAAVMSTPIDSDLIELDVVGSEAMVVVSPATPPLHGPAEISLTDLRDLPRVSLHEMHCLGQQISAFCAERRVSSTVVCHTTQLSTVLELVRLGMGVSIVPEMAARRDESAERRYARFRRGGPRREIAVARRAGRRVSRIADRFANLVAAQLAA